MPNALLRVILCWLTLSFSLFAYAADEAPADGSKMFATVWKIRGDVFAQGSNGVPRHLHEGSSVYVGERVRASSTGEAALKTLDGGVVAVRPGSEFQAESYAAEGKKSDNQILRLFTGSLRVVSGWIGKLNRDENKIVTPQATIGIRGTDHEPYVLSAEMAASSGNKEGTYDKVNRGGTSLDVSGNSVDIDPGKVGFARAVKPTTTRALMTLLLPVLLDKVPNFYVPGQFDADIDRYSKTADATAAAQLKQLENQGKSGDCNASRIAETWIKQLDDAIVKRDAKTITALFADDAVARATVRNTDGSNGTIEFDREELAQSTLAAIEGLKDYKHRRISIDGKAGEGETCQRVQIKSVVLEQGKMNGKPYRFESLEEYRLENRNGRWLAVRAETTQH
jgi:hypothetical protein